MIQKRFLSKFTVDFFFVLTFSRHRFKSDYGKNKYCAAILEHVGGKIHIITGYDLTTRIINRIIAEQSEYLTVTKPAPPVIKNDVTIYGVPKKEHIPLHRELVASLENCRNYINKKYLNVGITTSHVEDIFRYLCSDINWRIFINNKIESEILNKVIFDLVIPIENLTQSRGVYNKIIEEMDNQCLFPKVRPQAP